MERYPLIKFVLIFILGIILQYLFLIEGIVIYFICVSATFIFVLLSLLRKYNISVFQNILLIIAISACGASYYTIMKNDCADYPFTEPKIKNAVVIGNISSIDLLKKDNLVFEVDADTTFWDDDIYAEDISIRSRIKLSQRQLREIYNKIGVGNRIKIIGTIIRPRNERNPGEFDYQKYLSQQGISCIINVYKKDDFVILSNETSVLSNSIHSVRKSIDAVISATHNSSTSALLRGLLLADKSLIENDLRNEFVNAGVIHVLAVSGLHVGFVILIFIFLFRRMNVYLRFVLTVLGLFSFMIITNTPASVTRATIMAISMLIAPIAGRNYNSINSLALSALIILLFDPSQLFNPGFQLSFSAVLSIVIIYPKMSKSILKWSIKSKVISYLLLFFSVSFAAQVGTLPFTLAYFHRLSLVAFAANLIVIPLIGVIVGLGIFTIVIAQVFASLSLYYASANELLSYILFSVVVFSGSLSFSYLTVSQFSMLDSIIFYLSLGMILTLWNRLNSTAAKVIFMILIISNCLVWFSVDNYKLLPDNKLSVVAIDIGQGDSFLIKFPDGKYALIDAGDATQYFDNGVNVIAPLLERLGIDKIDYGFITHIDSDHFMGYYTIVKKHLIKEIIKPQFDPSSQKDIDFEKFLRNMNIPIHYHSKNADKIGGAAVYMLNDTTDNFYYTLSSNDKSGVLKIAYGKTSFLFMGDAGIKTEKYYQKKYGSFLKVDVLKAGHHGSKTSSSESFVNLVKPKLAIISAGVANKFKHPHKDVIERFERHNAKILRTDLSGAIILQSDGYEIKNISWNKE